MRKTFLMLLIALLLLSGCGQRSAEHSFFALDTVISLKCAPSSAKEIESIVKEYELILSPTSEKSELYLINSGQLKTPSKKFAEIFEEAKNMYLKTDGAYNAAIYPLILKWGFTTKNYAVPTKDELCEILPLTDFTKIEIDDKITLPEGAKLDFGGIAKGFICDKAVEVLKEKGEKNALISLGGNVYALGNKGGEKWEIAIKSPFADEFAGVLKAENEAVVTSGAYERYFEKNGEKYHHILNPETGTPAENDLASVTIVSENATLADAYSTALFVMGFEKAVNFYKNENNFNAIFILKNGKIYVTEGIAENFSATSFDIIY